MSVYSSTTTWLSLKKIVTAKNVALLCCKIHALIKFGEDGTWGILMMRRVVWLETEPRMQLQNRPRFTSKIKAQLQIITAVVVRMKVHSMVEDPTCERWTQEYLTGVCYNACWEALVHLGEYTMKHNERFLVKQISFMFAEDRTMLSSKRTPSRHWNIREAQYVRVLSSAAGI